MYSQVEVCNQKIKKMHQILVFFFKCRYIKWLISWLFKNGTPLTIQVSLMLRLNLFCVVLLDPLGPHALTWSIVQTTYSLYFLKNIMNKWFIHLLCFKKSTIRKTKFWDESTAGIIIYLHIASTFCMFKLECSQLSHYHLQHTF